MKEQQKARIVELAERCEHAMKVARGSCGVDLRMTMGQIYSGASAEAFRIAQEARQ